MKTKHRGIVTAILTCALVLGGAGAWNAVAETTTWNGSAWDNGVPEAGDDAIIASGTYTLSSSSAALNSMTVQNGATLLFDNWGTTLTATTVTVDSGGTITHAVCDIGSDPSNTNRVHIVCTDLTVNGAVNVDKKGYQGKWGTGQGPGGGEAAGGEGRAAAGGHGGFGGHYDDLSDFRAGGKSYGARYAPITPGSAGGSAGIVGGDGGGVVTIEASGTVTVAGSVSAQGEDGGPGTGGSNKNGGGAGGSIYIYCDTLAGGGSITADGGDAGRQSASGAGGRVAIWRVTDSWSGAAITANAGPVDNGYDVGENGTVEQGTLVAYGDPATTSPNEWTAYKAHTVYGGDASLAVWDDGDNWTALRPPAENDDVWIAGDYAAIMSTNIPPELGPSASRVGASSHMRVGIPIALRPTRAASSSPVTRSRLSRVGVSTSTGAVIAAGRPVR